MERVCPGGDSDGAVAKMPEDLMEAPSEALMDRYEGVHRPFFKCLPDGC
jgi:hypothetical protein